MNKPEAAGRSAEHSCLHKSRDKPCSSQLSALLVQDLVRSLLRKGQSHRLEILQATEGTCTRRCDSACASMSPESHRRHLDLTSSQSQQHLSQLWHRRPTLLPVSSSKRTVSIQSKKPVPDAIFFHHSFQIMLGSNRSHLYLLQEATCSTFTSPCHRKMRCTQDIQ